MSTINKMHFTEDYIFGANQGFNIAVAFTDLDYETESILDPTYV